MKHLSLCLPLNVAVDWLSHLLRIFEGPSFESRPKEFWFSSDPAGKCWELFLPHTFQFAIQTIISA